MKSKDDVTLIQTEAERELVTRIKDRYRASFMYKESLGLHSAWSEFEDYWAGDVNTPEDEDDPGSETNIVQPIIESQVADLVDGQIEFTVKGVGPSDDPFAKDVKHIYRWIWMKNQMIQKLDEAERDRLNLGAVGWKVYWDKDAMQGRGLVTIDPCSPDTLFPDPKIKDARRLQEGDFFIQVLPFSLGELRRRFGKRAKAVKPEGRFKVYNPQIFGEDEADNMTEVINDQALLYEYWEKDDEGMLRRVYMAGDVILDDSDWEHKSNDGARKQFYEHGRYPFVIINCYRKKGRLWGIGDTQQLIPIQDMINDFDDQIRMNARMMGNLQIVVGTAAGINLKKWVNRPGLKIPAKDHTAWQTVQPYPIPGYIPMRRDKGFQESELVSGRSDVVEGRRSGSLRAAAAIVALQEAGSRRANHKKLMLQEGFNEISSLVFSTAKEFMTVEQAFDITENDGVTKYMWFRPSNLKKIPWKTYNENFNPVSDEPGTDLYKNLYDNKVDENGQPVLDENGQPVQEMVTKDAELDIEVNFGAGMPNNKSFIYQAAIELHRENIITQEEARKTLKDILNWPIIDPYAPVGTFAGRNNSADQLAVANGQPQMGEQPEGGSQQVPQPQQQPMPQGEPPLSPEEQQQMVMEALGGMDPAVLNKVLAQMGVGMG